MKVSLSQTTQKLEQAEQSTDIAVKKSDHPLSQAISDCRNVANVLRVSNEPSISHAQALVQFRQHESQAILEQLADIPGSGELQESLRALKAQEPRPHFLNIAGNIKDVHTRERNFRHSYCAGNSATARPLSLVNQPHSDKPRPLSGARARMAGNEKWDLPREWRTGNLAAQNDKEKSKSHLTRSASVYTPRLPVDVAAKERDEAYHIYDAIKTIKEILWNGWDDVSDFVECKRLSAVSTVFANVLTETLGIAAGTSGSMVGAMTPAPAVGSFAGSMLTKEALKTVLPEFTLLPAKNMSHQAKHASQSTSDRLKELSTAAYWKEHWHSLAKAASKKTIDKVGNKALDIATQSAIKHTVGTSISIPFGSIFFGIKSAIEFKNTSKEDVLNYFVHELELIKNEIDVLNARMLDLFQQYGECRPYLNSDIVISEFFAETKRSQRPLKWQINVGSRHWKQDINFESYQKHYRESLEKLNKATEWAADKLAERAVREVTL